MYLCLLTWGRTVWVCVAALTILDRLEEIDQDTLGWWLAERQLPSGGLNGRPDKLEDVSCVRVQLIVHVSSSFHQVCYSHWVLSSMSILNKISWINAEKISAFILSAQVRRTLHRVYTTNRLTARLRARMWSMAVLRIGQEMSLTFSIRSLVLPVSVTRSSSS